jgi:hypothetical protein
MDFLSVTQSKPNCTKLVINELGDIQALLTVLIFILIHKARLLRLLLLGFWVYDYAVNQGLRPKDVSYFTALLV